MFWYRLAAHQRRSVAETMAAVDSDEFNYWAAYMQLETLDFDGYMQAGQICALVANALDTKRQYKPDDFIPRVQPKRRKARDTYRMMRMMYHA